MPRQPRLDAPGTLHHVIGRGIERRPIFLDDADREDFLRRVESLVCQGAFLVYAWALMDNHFHLLVKTLGQRLHRSMRSLLTGYAGRFNRRHGRVGHLFQNRYRSIVCEEETYFLALVRYIHLNPLKDGVVSTLADLDRYPYSGHATLVGMSARHWQACDEVLARFEDHRDPRAAYRAFIASGVEPEMCPEAGAVGLVPVPSGFLRVTKLKRGREAFRAKDRILGTESFLQDVVRRAESRIVTPAEAAGAPAFETLLSAICSAAGVPVANVVSQCRLRSACRARDGLACLWIECLGRSARELAAALGVRRSPLYRAARRGRKHEAFWREVLATIEPAEAVSVNSVPTSPRGPRP
ncbi:MAG: transposase [Candidatus Binatia bacterium]